MASSFLSKTNGHNCDYNLDLTVHLGSNCHLYVCAAFRYDSSFCLQANELKSAQCNGVYEWIIRSCQQLLSAFIYGIDSQYWNPLLVSWHLNVLASCHHCIQLLCHYSWIGLVLVQTCYAQEHQVNENGDSKNKSDDSWIERNW